MANNYPLVANSSTLTIQEMSAGDTLLVDNIEVTGNANISGNLSLANVSVTGDATVGGNLSVNGTLTYINSTTVDVEDPIISLGGGANGNVLISDDGKDRGTALQYYSGSALTAFIGYDNSNAELTLATDVTIASDIVTVNSLGNVRLGNIVAANANVGNLDFGAGVINGTGNITGGNIIGIIEAGSNTITTTGNITGGNIIGIIEAGSNTITTTGNITGGNIIGIIEAGSNTITTTGNITGGNIIGTIEAGSNTITTTGNITGGNIIGALANGNSNVNIPAADGNVNISAEGNVNILVITGTGVNVAGTLNATGNANVGNLGTTDLIVSGNTSVGGDIIPSSNISYNLGNNTNRFNDIWLANSTIYLGDSTISAGAGNSITTTAMAIDGVANAAGGGATVGVKSVMNVDSAFGSSDPNDPASVQGVRGRVLGSNLTQTNNYVVGITGQYYITGTNASQFPKAGIMGVIGDQTTSADAAVMAYLDGDGGTTTAGAAFKVAMINTTASSGFDYGLDLQFLNTGVASSTQPYKQADVRLSNGLTVVAETNAVTDGDATSLPIGTLVMTSNATGAGMMFISNGSILKQLAFATP